MFHGKYKRIKYAVFYIVLAAIIVFAVNYVKSGVQTKYIDYTEFQTMLKNKQISRVEIQRDKIIITPKKSTDTRTYITSNVNDSSLLSKLNSAGVRYGKPNEETNPLINVVMYYIVPIFLCFLVLKMLFGTMDKKIGGGVISFGKNIAKLYAKDETGITFDDVAGEDEAKESLSEIVDFLHNPKKYTEIGAILPKGALLVGPPGTGKTLLARAIAGEARVPFFSLTGSDFVELFAGMGAARVRDLFKQAQQEAPCIVFIDEIDAIGKSREASNVGGNDEREQTLNQLLSEMDGFDSSKGVIILAATNRPEILDKALLRPGRFDRRVIVDTPDLIGREEILKVHLKSMRVSKNVNPLSIAKSTPGAVGADLANIVNEAALMAVKKNRTEILQEDLEEAVEIIIAGNEKKNRILSQSEKRLVAFHEVGHALTAAILKSSGVVHKITIIPRTLGSLGYTMQVPDGERYLTTKEEMMDKITVMLAGRSAEEVEFSSISTGAANDIERATVLARKMVTIYGMTDRFDMMALEKSTNMYLDEMDVLKCSSNTATIIDEETLKIIKACHKRAIEILSSHKEILNRIAEKLVEKETLLGEEFMNMVNEKVNDSKDI